MRICGAVFWVSGLGFRVSGLGMVWGSSQPTLLSSETLNGLDTYRDPKPSFFSIWGIYICAILHMDRALTPTEIQNRTRAILFGNTVQGGGALAHPTPMRSVGFRVWGLAWRVIHRYKHDVQAYTYLRIRTPFGVATTSPSPTTSPPPPPPPVRRNAD
jgi:hypothetical protein